jgi:hypothetical protein
MTEGEKAFYKRRQREELKKARAADHPNLRLLHLRWAQLYQDRLDGVPRSKLVMPPPLTVIDGTALELEDNHGEDLPRAA